MHSKVLSEVGKQQQTPRPPQPCAGMVLAALLITAKAWGPTTCVHIIQPVQQCAVVSNGILRAMKKNTRLLHRTAQMALSDGILSRRSHALPCRKRSFHPWLGWLECRPVQQKVSGSVPSGHIHRLRVQSPVRVSTGSNQWMFLSLPLPVSPKINLKP